MPISYAQVFDPIAPWGYWLTPVATAEGRVLWQDTDGSRWASVREAFWIGRLGMTSMIFADEAMDIIADALAEVGTKDKVGFLLGVQGPTRETVDFLQLWLNSMGLAEHGRDPLPLIKLSEEGVAVLAMLRATRRRPPANGWTPLLVHRQALLAQSTSVG